MKNLPGIWQRANVEFINFTHYTHPMKMKLEVVTVPVTDVDRAIKFYVDVLGFHLDGDWKMDGGIRYVQLTPVGSACSIVIGNNITTAQPGTIDSLLLVVEDIQQTHKELKQKEISVTDVEKMPWGAWHIYLSDPDGNKLTLQQKPVLENK
jgi:catechol 2,3-dioxygenase-like lactoylglutathione lyase family enzyme